MPSPFQDNNRPAPPASEWPTQPQWPAPPAPAATPPPPPPAPPAPPARPRRPPTRRCGTQPATPPLWQAQQAGPPMSPPPVPPSTPYGAAPGSPAPRRNSWTRSGSRIRMLVALVVAALGATAGGVASRAAMTSSSSTATAPPVTTTPAPVAGRLGPAARPPPCPTRARLAAQLVGALSSWDEVTAKVDVGVVDIESRMNKLGRRRRHRQWCSPPGEILTNNHVVEGASAIVVTVVTTGESYRATVVGTDPATTWPCCS